MPPRTSSRIRPPGQTARRHGAVRGGITDSNWLVWQLADSAFPTGSFAHACGLEAAWQQGEVRGRAELRQFVEASLHQLSRSALPFVMAAFDQPDELAQIDQRYHAFVTNHVANRASRAQGRALRAAAARIFGLQETAPAGDGKRPPGHFAPVFGALLRRLNIGGQITAELFFFSHLRGVLAAAVRLNIVGPLEAQALLYEITPQARAWAGCPARPLDQAAQTAPLLDLWQGMQDRLYSRLFQS